MSAIKIAIIGAGPGGLILARLLMESNSSFTIFEAETTREAWSQGGMVGLREESGLTAIRMAALYDKFLDHARVDAGALAITDKDLTRYVDVESSTASTITGGAEIDRRELREILIDSIPPECIRWGHRLNGIAYSAPNLTMYYDQGPDNSYHLIIGADGAFSKVRSFLSGIGPIYSGLSGVYCSIPDAFQHQYKLWQLVKQGSLFSYSHGRSITAQQLGDGSIDVGLTAVRSLTWLDDRRLSLNNVKKLKNAFLEELKGWHPQLLNLIQVADKNSFTERPLYMLPIGYRWKHRPGITMIGDAAHLMTPSAGLGVNLAMEDAMKLAKAIFDAQEIGPLDALWERIEEFEEDMFKRGKKAQELSWDQVEDLFFADGAPRTTIASCVGRMAVNETNVFIGAIIAVLAAIYFFFFNLFH